MKEPYSKPSGGQYGSGHSTGEINEMYWRKVREKEKRKEEIEETNLKLAHKQAEREKSALDLTEEANRIAKQSNETSKQANKYSVVAIVISIFAILISIWIANTAK